MLLRRRQVQVSRFGARKVRSGELRCVECDAVPKGAGAGWKAFLTGGYEGEPLEVGIFCPSCASRECGPR